MKNRQAIRDLGFFILFMTFIIGVSHWLFLHSTLLLDENVHYGQIRITLGLDTGEQIVSTLPVYHYVVGSIAKLLGSFDPPVLRSISLCLSLLFLAATFWTNLVAHPRCALIKTAQVALLPMVFPLLSLIYVDIFSAIFPVMAYGFFLRKQFYPASIACLLAVATRQTSLAWLFMFFCMSYIDSNGYRLTFRSVLVHCRSYPIFIVSGLLFLAFVLWNGGLVMGGWRDSHAITALYFSNIYFFFFVFLLTFFPRIICQLPFLWQQLQIRRWLLLAGVLYLLGYFTLFEIEHEWNFSRAPPPLLRNLVLQYLFDHKPVFIAGGFFSLLAFLSMLAQPLIVTSGWLLYLVSMLMLLSINLVEPRYYLMTLVGFLFLARGESRQMELLQTFWLFLIAAGIVWGHHKIWFFL